MKSEKNAKSCLAIHMLIKGRETDKILFVTLKKTWQTLNVAYSKL